MNYSFVIFFFSLQLLSSALAQSTKPAASGVPHGPSQLQNQHPQIMDTGWSSEQSLIMY